MGKKIIFIVQHVKYFEDTEPETKSVKDCKLASNVIKWAIFIDLFTNSLI